MYRDTFKHDESALVKAAGIELYTFTKQKQDYERFNADQCTDQPADKYVTPRRKRHKTNNNNNNSNSAVAISNNGNTYDDTYHNNDSIATSSSSNNNLPILHKVNRMHRHDNDTVVTIYRKTTTVQIIALQLTIQQTNVHIKINVTY